MEYRGGVGVALALICAAFAVPASAQTVVPALRFHLGAEELAAAAETGRYDGDPARLAEDVRWVENNADDLVDWWEGQGRTFLSRAGAYAGLPWPYQDIEVYVVRRWPVISIEYPLVVALDTVEGGGTPVELPDQDDFRILILAHQLTHYLLDDPTFLPRDQRHRAYEHPFLAPGDLEVEAMVNWVVYAVLEELWGRQRLQRATGEELWRTYNPNHAYVVDELTPRRRLGPGTTLVQWLSSNGPGSEIFRIHDSYSRQRREPEPTPQLGRNLSGTPYGLELGATFEGAIFVAYVDPSSAADRAGARQGDVLVTLEGRPVGNDVVDAQRRLDESWRDDGEINLSVLRDGREVFLTVGRR